MIYIKQVQPTIKLPGLSSFTVKFNYDKRLVDVIHQVPNAIWHKQLGVWEIPLTSLSRAVNLLSNYEEIDLELLENVKEDISYLNNKKSKLHPENYKVNLFNHQQEGVMYGLEHDRFLLLDMPGLGKAFTLDTPILSDNGFIPMSDISVGDKVYGEDGKLYSVTATYNHDALEMYDITFSDGVTVRCCKDHLWEVNYMKNLWNTEGKYYTHEYVNECHDVTWLLQNDRYKKKEIAIPRCAPIEFTKKDLPIDPYVLGCILGDGSITHDVGFTSADSYIIEKINSGLPGSYFCKYTGYDYDYIITSPEGMAKHTTRSGNLIKNKLKELELYGKNSYNKHIPDIYKYSCVEDRKELVRGLIDTDGYATKDNVLQFSSSSKQLFDDFVFLIESLGGIVNKSSSVASYINEGVRKKCAESYTATVRIDDPSDLCSLPRKRNLLQPRKFKPRRLIKSIVYAGTFPGKCITVDNPSHLYLAKDFIVTHNTLQMIYLAEELKARDNIEHCFIICGINTLKYNWKKEIEKFSNFDCKILGERVTRTGKEKIGSVKDRLEDLQNPIDEFFIITNIETLRNDGIVKELKKKKPVNKIDMMVLDECHTIKNPTSIQSKSLLKLSAKYMVGLTGTLLLNSPVDAYVPLKWLGIENSTYTNYKYYYCDFSGPFNNILEGYKNTEVLKDQLEKYGLRRTKDLLDLPEKTIIHEELVMEDDQSRFYNNIIEGIAEQVDKVHINTSTILSMVTRLRQATACPSILSSEKISAIKIDRTVDLINQLIDNNEKVVVFSVFKPTLDEIADKVKQYNPLICTGDLSDDIISENIDRFQNDDKYKVMLATIAKMGTGITLNKASYAIFIDAPWTAAAYQQAQDRIHRIGSKNPVFIYELIVKDTIDERVRQIVETKEAIADYIIDDKLSQSSIDNLKKYILDIV